MMISYKKKELSLRGESAHRKGTVGGTSLKSGQRTNDQGHSIGKNPISLLFGQGSPPAGKGWPPIGSVEKLARKGGT